MTADGIIIPKRKMGTLEREDTEHQRYNMIKRITSYELHGIHYCKIGLNNWTCDSSEKKVLSIATDDVKAFPHGYVEYPHTFSRGPFFVSHIPTSDHFLFPKAMSQSGSLPFF